MSNQPRIERCPRCRARIGSDDESCKRCGMVLRPAQVELTFDSLPPSAPGDDLRELRFDSEAGEGEAPAPTGLSFHSAPGVPLDEPLDEPTPVRPPSTPPPPPASAAKPAPTAVPRPADTVPMAEAEAEAETGAVTEAVTEAEAETEARRPHEPGPETPLREAARIRGGVSTARRAVTREIERRGPATSARAPVSARLVALVIDLAYLLGMVGFVVLLGAAVFWLDGGSPSQGSSIWTPLLLLTVVLAVGFEFVTVGLLGATPGLRSMGLRVATDADEGAPGWAQAFVRAVTQVISLLPAGIGAVTALTDARGRTVYDLLAGTRVVREPLVLETPDE